MPEKSKRQKRLDNGYCGTCGTHRIVDSPTCDRCKETIRRNHKLRIIERKKHRLCTTCGKNQSDLGKKTCHRCLEKRAGYLAKNKQKYETNRRYFQQKLKRQVMDYYGVVCVCCKESGIRFLTIDHINGDGKEHRQQLSKNGSFGGDNLYRWLRKNGFPEGFQTLCYNCNIGKYRNNNICPHQDNLNGV